jgi:alpha(1,3/1,4) fucosyltransferase
MMLRFIFQRTTRFLRNYRREKQNAKRYKIGFYNFWEQETPGIWLYEFLESRQLLQRAKNSGLSFFSVFGPRFKIHLDRGKVNVFYTGENVQSGRARRYIDNALLKSIDLSIGFEYIEHEKYLRFPVWVMALFPAGSSEKDILGTCKKLTHPEFNSGKKFASLIARHDSLGIREKMFTAISQINRVDSEGTFMNNNLDLKEVYNDDKILYLKNYMFNICPENSDTKGYVTEKIFDAIKAGCIPIYWGSDNFPEPDILNQKSILFWDNNQEQLLQTVQRLWTSEAAYRDFMNQPRLLPEAGEQIIDMFNKLEHKFRSIL